jgi:hypothetical protein
VQVSRAITAAGDAIIPRAERRYRRITTGVMRDTPYAYSTRRWRAMTWLFRKEKPSLIRHNVVGFVSRKCRIFAADHLQGQPGASLASTTDSSATRFLGKSIEVLVDQRAGSSIQLFPVFTRRGGGSTLPRDENRVQRGTARKVTTKVAGAIRLERSEPAISEVI